MKSVLQVNKLGRAESRRCGIKIAAVALSLLALAVCARADDSTAPTLPSPLCDSLQVPAGNQVVFHVYAVGVQIYQWNGTAWVFIGPAATLYADPGYNGQVGTHFLTPGSPGGPTWESNSGSLVIGKRIAACMPDTTAIPWLKLVAIYTQGPGVFDGVSFVQRVNTVGGKAPSTPGTTVGQEADVAYTAEYYFYAPTSTDSSDDNS